MSTTQNWVLTVASVAGTVTSGAAAMTIWLLLTHPLTVANAVDTRTLAPLVQAAAGALVTVLEAIVRYL